MTRKEFIKKYKNDCRYYFDGYYRDCIDDFLTNIYNDHEAQLKAKESDLERQDMIIKCLNIDLDNKEKLLKAKDEEIAKYQIAIDKQSKRAKALKQLSLEKDEEIAIAKSRHKLEHERYLIFEAIVKEKDEEIERLKEAMQEFVSRAEKGEVRSSYTYSKFKELLKDNQCVV